MKKLDDPTIFFDLYTLFLTARDLAPAVYSMQDTGDGSLSKYAFYLAMIKDGDNKPQVVRCLVDGWGGDQHEAVISAASDSSFEPTENRATAVIADYGTGGSQQIKVTVFAHGYALHSSFAYRITCDEIEYVQSAAEAQRQVLLVIGEWQSVSGATSRRKKFLGLF